MVEIDGGIELQEGYHITNIASENSESQIYFPVEAIKSLRLELSNLLGEKLAAGALFRFGYRCGEAFVERFNMDKRAKEDLNEVLINIWQGTGLGNIRNIEEISKDEVIVEQENSTESKVQGSVESPSCDFTRGYLAGIANMLTQKKYYCVETACISEGKDICTFRLIEFPHKVYVTKNPP